MAGRQPPGHGCGHDGRPLQLGHRGQGELRQHVWRGLGLLLPSALGTACATLSQLFAVR